MLNRQRGKRTEKSIAKLLDGKRIGILGKDDIQTYDGRFSIEVKDRKKCVVTGFMEQAKRNCGEKIPLVVLHITGSRHDEDIVMMRMENWKEMLDEKKI